LPELAGFRKRLEQAWLSKGQKLTDDIYKGEVNGLFKCVNSVYKGVRSSSWVFVEDKPNIHILANTQAKKINFDGTTATGVTVIHNNRKVTFKARNEVIVSCGVFETPKLLMLSGIGPAEHLQSHGITPLVESAHVGQNVLDHPILSHVFRVKDGYGLDNILLRAGPEQKAAIAQYQKDGSGPLGSTLLETIAFPRIDDWLMTSKEYVKFKEENGGIDPFGPAGQPHFEIDFVVSCFFLSLFDNPRLTNQKPMFADAFQWHIPNPQQGEYLTVIVDLLRPLSQNGEIKLRSTDPLEQPYINLNYFSNELDLVALREGVRFIDDILMNGEGFKDIIGEEYPFPMPRRSDEAMKTAIKERCQTGYRE
jgi:choline dehydrogenase-like flavoprotein